MLQPRLAGRKAPRSSSTEENATPADAVPFEGDARAAAGMRGVVDGDDFTMVEHGARNAKAKQKTQHRIDVSADEINSLGFLFSTRSVDVRDAIL